MKKRAMEATKKREKREGATLLSFKSTLVLQSSTCTSVCREFSYHLCITMWGPLHYRTWLVYSNDEPPQKSSCCPWIECLQMVTTCTVRKVESLKILNSCWELGLLTFTHGPFGIFIMTHPQTVGQVQNNPIISLLTLSNSCNEWAQARLVGT